jgi:hypothetical protein
VIARFAWDSHFPGPVWAPAQRVVVDPPPLSRLAIGLAQLDQSVARGVTVGGG